MKRFLKKSVFLIICLLFICAIGFKILKPANVEVLPNPKGVNSKIIYNRVSNRLVTYNTLDKTVEQDFNILNFMQYSFSNQSKYYTSGHSYENGFEILKVNNNKIEHIYRPKDSEKVAIFPFASNNNINIYSFVTYDSNNKEMNRYLIELQKENNLINYKEVDGLITSGVIIKDKLYYTVYNVENDKFSLYNITLGNYNDKPSLVTTNLESGDIFNCNDELYLSDEKYIYNDNNKFNKKHTNLFIKDNLIQMYINEKGSVILEVYNITKQKIIKKYSDAIGYDINNNELTIYCYGNMEKLIF